MTQNKSVKAQKSMTCNWNINLMFTLDSTPFIANLLLFNENKKENITSQKLEKER